MLATLKQLWKDEEGPTAVEYAIMVALIAVAIIGTVRLLGQSVEDVFDGVNSAL